MVDIDWDGVPLFGKLLGFYFFLSGSRKKKGNKKERLPSALFELFQSGIPLKEKNSLRSNSFSFLTLHTSPSISRSKSEAGHSWRNIASLVGVGVFSFILCYIHSRTN